ncbi:MAG TPA: rhomboid family intramembrane serine protease [Acidobacteriaceae bacterium]|nr:rhomboid family intramembrane serine protease [Acidobacteriaceae bacterium]
MPRLTSGVFGFSDFRGVTRQLVLWNLASFFLLLILGVFARGLAADLTTLFALDPGLVLRHGFVWQLATYPLVHFGIIGTLLELLSLWFTASFLEANHGSRWLLEIFFVSVVGAGLCGLVLSLFVPPMMPLFSCWGGIFGLLIVYGVRYGDLDMMLFPLPMTIKAKYFVWVWMLVAAALLFTVMHLAAIAELGGALFGWLYLRFAPRRGFAFAGSESLFGLRNQYYRWKRRRAARKFEVYMRKHRDN